MKFFIAFLFVVSPFFLSAQPDKKMCITIDDLPFVTRLPLDVTQKKIYTQQILSALVKHRVPATGFVNEGKMFRNDTLMNGYTALLEDWLKRGMDLGNHTWSHMDYNTHTLAQYSHDVIRGSLITDSLFRVYHKQMKYFRHPYLRRGNSREKVDSLELFLKAHHYTEAPVTVDNSDWVFARALDNLYEKNDTAGIMLLGQKYIRYMEDKLHYYEAESDSVFSRNISHVLLIHANILNSLFLDELLAMYERNGYIFVSLDEALTDPAYKTEDTYVRGGGISWIHRWAISRGLPKSVYYGEPAVPGEVMQLAGVESE